MLASASPVPASCLAYLNATAAVFEKVVPAADRCACATHIAASEEGLFPYVQWHYCTLECVPAVAFFLVAVWILFLFSITASTADEYIVPLLERLSDRLGLSPNVAGVTLLAMGNGAPEFFTLFAAFKGGNGSVGVGSLLGGGMFITTVVLGSVALIAPFRPHRRPLLRDIAFYFCGTLVLACACLDGKIVQGEALLLFFIYVAYVVVVIAGRWIFQSYLRRSGDAVAPLHPVGAAGGRDAALLDLEDFPGRMNLTRYLRHERHAEAGAQLRLPTAHAAAYPLHEEGRSGVVTAMLALSAEAAAPRPTPEATLESVVGYAWAWRDQVRPLPKAAPAPSIQSDAALPSPAASFSAISGGTPMRDDAASLLGGGAVDADANADADADGAPPLMSPMVVPWALRRASELIGWESKGTFARLVYPLEALLVVARDLTIPMLEPDAYSRTVCAVAALGAPTFITLHMAGGARAGHWPAWAVVLLAGAPLAVALRAALPTGAPPRGSLELGLLLAGFASAIFWTDLLAGELVAALEYVGVALGISPAILGLTVLAWGNSVGDFIADTALARAGNPRMGAASCFGSPLFNMLIGFGFSLMYATFAHGPFCISRDKTVPIGVLFLLGSMIMSAVAIPCSGFTLTRRYGAVLIGYYVVFLACSLLLETAVAESWWDEHVWPWFRLGSATC